MNSPALGFNRADSPALGMHPHLDIDEQNYSLDQHRNKMHSEWVQHHSSRTSMDHPNSRVKALLLVQEAARLELTHLAHQRDHAKYLLSRMKQNNSNGKFGSDQKDQDDIFGSPARIHKENAAVESSTATAGAARKKDESSTSNTPSSKQGLSATRSSNSSINGTQHHHQSPRTERRSLSPDCCASSPARRGDRTIGAADATPSPTKRSNCCGSAKKKRPSSAPAPPQPVSCGCLHVAGWRLMTPRFRVMALLKKHGEVGNLDAIVDALRQTYTSDAEMIEDMDARYGPEPTEIDAELLARSVEERFANHNERWINIRESVDMEMQTSAQAFQNVIRTLSVMRIFIEGSQGQVYGIDFTDRQRREAAQQSVLQKLRANRALFVDQCPKH